MLLRRPSLDDSHSPVPLNGILPHPATGQQRGFNVLARRDRAYGVDRDLAPPCRVTSLFVAEPLARPVGVRGYGE